MGEGESKAILLKRGDFQQWNDYTGKVGFIKFSSSHSVVSRAAPALGTDPVDVLTVVLDVAGLAVDAVGGVDDELHVAGIVGLVLVHPGRTKPALRSSKLCPVDFLRNIVIEQGQVGGLVGFVVCSCQSNRREKIKCELPVRFWIFYFFTLAG